MLALFKRDAAAHLCDEKGVPPKQQEQRKPREKKPVQPMQPMQPVQQVQTPVATVMAMPLAAPMMNMPLAAASPVPMQPLGLMPTAWPLHM